MSDKPQYSTEQLAAIETDAENVVVLSAAGSGKSRVIIGRIQKLVERGVQPDRIACVTFTTAGAKVLAERLGFKIGFCGTLHAWMLRLLNAHAELVGYSRGVGVLDKEASSELLEQVRQEQRYRGTESQLQDALVQWPNALAHPTPAQLVVSAYRHKLRSNNAADFASILHYGHLLVQQLADDGEWEYEALLVDEYQDTAPKHAEIYRAMPCKWKFYAGDKWQSIFSFMGSSVDNIVGECMIATVFRMEHNYRCAANICAAASKLQSAGGGTERTLPRPDAPQGRVELTCYEDFTAECRGMAQRIRELEAEKDAAILVRTNALVQSYSMAIESYGIPVARRKVQAQPHDWNVVSTLLAALGAPDNDLLCCNFIAALKGSEQAHKSRREAAVAMVGVNAHCLHLPADLDAEQAVQIVAKTRPSAESVARLQAAMSLLEPDASVGDLQVALAEPPKQEVESSGVIVSTIHGFKGCEAGTVLLPCWEEGMLPSHKDAGEHEALAEARRLAYVAITRAKQNLFLSYCRTRQDSWRREATVRRVSRFAAEAGLQEV